VSFRLPIKKGVWARLSRAKSPLITSAALGKILRQLKPGAIADLARAALLIRVEQDDLPIDEVESLVDAINQVAAWRPDSGSSEITLPLPVSEALDVIPQAILGTSNYSIDKSHKDPELVIVLDHSVSRRQSTSTILANIVGLASLFTVGKGVFSTETEEEHTVTRMRIKVSSLSAGVNLTLNTQINAERPRPFSKKVIKRQSLLITDG
jgi:hypothetical protein